MTVSKNRVEIRQSTATTDRITASVNYLSARLDPDKMRYAFPDRWHDRVYN